MDEPKVTGFSAYPSSPPSSGEAIRQSVETINRQGIVFLQTWEECRVGGKIIVDELCKAIDATRLFCADLTGMNANVMFELGYAIAREKRIWLLLDPTYVDSNVQFEQLRVLTTVGYARYSNSSEIVNRFNHDQPYSDLENTLFEQAIRRNLTPSVKCKVLYLKSLHETEASIQISKAIAKLEDRDIPVIVDDPKESAAQSLTWYGTQVYSADSVVCHLTSPSRVGARLHNARYALVAGMALGMGRRLLMLAEGDFLAPIDYRDLVFQYQTAAQASKHLAAWLEPLEQEFCEERGIQKEHAAHIKLATELKELQIGEYIAENEADRLVQEYFVETSAYREALTGNQIVFVGRKGSGKTANLFKVATELAKDRRNLVCIIKPVAYEIQGLIDLLKKYKERDAKGYAIESLWKFLILTEMASAALESARKSASAMPPPEEDALLKLFEREGAKLSGDFAVRLERCVNALISSQTGNAGIETTRVAISEALHQREIGDLRIALGEVLSSTQRVAILIDNLDKAWDKQSDQDILAEFLLGLLGAANRLGLDFSRADSRRKAVSLTSAVFLRSDIFDRIVAVAREPDKITYSKLRWGDRELLTRVVEERFVASHEGSVRPEQMWRKYFCPKVGGMPIREYFVSRILPRPRDLVFFVKSAVATAVNRNHASVTQEDVLEAERQYSQFAFGNILVENGTTLPRLEDVLFEFVGCPPVLAQDEIASRLSKVGVSGVNETIELLCFLSFLGLETRKNRFRFVDEPQEYRKALALALQLAQHRRSSLRYEIHPAFRTFLEIGAN